MHLPQYPRWRNKFDLFSFIYLYIYIVATIIWTVWCTNYILSFSTHGWLLTAVRGHRLLTAVRGHRLLTGVRGHRLLTAVRGHPLLTAVRRHRLLTAVRRHRLLTAVRGHPLLTAVRGHPLLTAARGHPLLTAVRRHRLLTAVRGHAPTSGAKLPHTPGPLNNCSPLPPITFHFTHHCNLFTQNKNYVAHLNTKISWANCVQFKKTFEVYFCCGRFCEAVGLRRLPTAYRRNFAIVHTRRKDFL